jgi:hypothetical protein
MKKYNTPEELVADGQEGVIADLKKDNLFDLNIVVEDPTATGLTFERVFGGFIYVCETEADLSKIYTCTESELPEEQQDPDLGGWASIREIADSFDDCNWTKAGDYARLFLATNNSGGNCFYVPKHLADLEPNIQRSIELTNMAWNREGPIVKEV